MQISDAVKQATACNGFILRAWWRGHMQVRPGTGPMCCIAYGKGEVPRPRWQPQAEDLMAEDWEVTTEELI